MAPLLDTSVSSRFWTRLKSWTSLRGQGVGRLLLGSALAAARASGAELVALEVRVTNADAIALYLAAGFREVGRRKKYYDNGEDAILMDYTFGKDEECDAV
jgi:[ribosomal protein S18]-alanine N-acetyltransferase